MGREVSEPMVHLLGRLRVLQYEIEPLRQPPRELGAVFELTTPDDLLTLTITEAEYFRDPAGCVANIRRMLRRFGYPT